MKKKTKHPEVIEAEKTLKVIGYIVRHRSVHAPGQTDPMYFGNENGDEEGGKDCKFWFHSYGTLFTSREDARKAIESDRGLMHSTCIYRDSDYFIGPVYVVA